MVKNFQKQKKATDKTKREKLKSTTRHIELYRTKIKQLSITYLSCSIHDFVLHFNLHNSRFYYFLLAW